MTKSTPHAKGTEVYVYEKKYKKREELLRREVLHDFKNDIPDVN